MDYIIYVHIKPVFTTGHMKFLTIKGLLTALPKNIFNCYNKRKGQKSVCRFHFIK